MREIAIEINNIGKKYKLGQRGPAYTTLRDSISGMFKKKDKISEEEKESAELWALDDINLKIERGDVVGVIGRNGAGKSTLLKILSRITEPSTGQISLKGRIGSLLEVGTGFHPELTGRENIYLNGSIIGMRKKEIEDKFDEIIAFSEIERFIDTPVKHYSSGMYVRLAFAVAAHLEPEILLVDEVLAVGDLQFQKKCLGKMQDVASQGRTVLFVSHNMAAVKRLCTKGVLLDKGKLAYYGDVEEAVHHYVKGMGAANQFKVEFALNEKISFTILDVEVCSDSGREDGLFLLGDKIKVKVKYRVNEDVKGSNIDCLVKKDGVEVFRTWDTDLNEELLYSRTKGDYISEFTLPEFLNYGTYSLSFSTGKSGVGVFERKEDCIIFDIVNPMVDGSHKSFTRNSLVKTEIKWETLCLK